MEGTVRVELHCHSISSDGFLLPEQIAEKLATARVHYAALTDHNTLEGQVSFKNASTRHDIGFISGIELTTYFEEKEIHLLGYGFDLNNEDLQSTLQEIRPLRNGVSPNFIVQKKLSSIEGISLIHKAGGIVFLAHPSITEPNLEKCAHIIETLSTAGLDGVEAFRPDCLPEVYRQICTLAKHHNLLISAGTDSHFTQDGLIRELGVDIPRETWKKFRNAVLVNSSRRIDTPISETLLSPAERNPIKIHWHSFARHIIIPAMLALLLFAGVLIFAVLPAFERALLDRKREMIRELTNVASSILAEAAQDEVNGILTKEDARIQAIKRIESMRYGSEGKDYFWIQDTTPHMIMHPYRKDLNGTDLSGFTDPRGIAIFIEFAKLVKEKNEGYVNYVWQWKDDPERLEQKESYIRLFEPWGWIIGTGLYVYDVKEELNRLQKRLTFFSAGIFAIVTLLLVYVMRSSLCIEKERVLTEEHLREATNRYKILVDAATEGMLYVNEYRCRYGNPMALEMLGYLPSEVELLDVFDIFPDVNGNAIIHKLIKNMHEKSQESSVVGVMQHKDGSLLECSIMVQPTGSDISHGFLLLLRHPLTTFANNQVQSQGVLSRLLKLPFTITENISEDIQNANNREEIAKLCLQTPKLVLGLLENGMFAPEIARMLSVVTDAVTRKFISLGIREFGEPPVPFAFMALGSQGRMEQTLFTDQDNAVIYSLLQGVVTQSISEYFEKLTEYVCSGLTSSGYHECKAKVMANNPQWCQSLTTWKDYFSRWIHHADLHELMEFSIFFDYRVVFGDESIANELRNHIFKNVQQSPNFFTQVAQNALQFKSPVRLFGIRVGAPGTGEGSQLIDLKATTMPIVSFSRLYSLQQGISETNTIARIDELVRNGIILPSKQEEIQTAFALLLRLRLRHQSALIQSGGQPDNLVNPSTLGHIEEAILRECYNEIDLLQTRIRRDFLGGG